MFYIYAYYEPERAEPFYIGKGTGNRSNEHLKETCLNLNDRFHKKLRKLINDGFQPDIEIIVDNLNETDSFEIERRLIKQYGKIENGGTLYNMTDGGEGISGLNHSQESIEKMRMASTGRKLSVEARNKISQNSIDSWTDQRRKEQSERLKSNNLNKQYANTLKRPIRQLLYGKIIREFGGINEVKIVGFAPCCIKAVLARRRTLAYGYQREYI